MGRVVDKVNALLNVALESVNTRLQQLLLLLSDIAKHVNSLLGAVGLIQRLARGFREYDT